VEKSAEEQLAEDLRKQRAEIEEIDRAPGESDRPKSSA
jgi:hypothetical protein